MAGWRLAVDLTVAGLGRWPLTLRPKVPRLECRALTLGLTDVRLESCLRIAGPWGVRPR